MLKWTPGGLILASVYAEGHNKIRWLKAFILIFGSLAALAAGMSASQATLVISCKLDDQTIDFGTLNSLDYQVVSAPSQLKISCRNPVSLTIGMCFMIYPDNVNDKLSGLSGYRMIWKDGKRAAGNPVVPFNFYIGNTNSIWGAGADNQDYGNPVKERHNDWSVFRDYEYYFPFTAKIGLTGLGVDIPVGNYVGNYNARLYYVSMHDPNTSTLCAKDETVFNRSTATATVTIKAVMKAACGVKVNGAMNFGKQFSLASPIYATTSILAKCSGKATYSLDLDAGQNPDSFYTNAMKCMSDTCGGATIQYLLYKDAAHTAVWNSKKDPSSTVKDNVEAEGYNQYTVYGATIPTADTPPPGTYKDTVVVTLTSQFVQ